MKKVLFFINTLGGGGAERVLVNLVNNLDRSKFDITVKTLFDVGVNRNYLNSNVKYESIFKWVFRGNSQILKLLPPSLLFSIMIKNEYDIIVAYLQGVPTRIVGGYSGKDTRLIAWLHSDMRKFPMKSCFWSDRELLTCLEQYDAIVGVSKTVIDSFSEVTGIRNKLYVKYNINDVKNIQSSSEEPVEEGIFQKNQVNVCTVGRLVREKGFDRLLRVHKRLIDSGHMHTLYIFGDGAGDSALREFIVENNIQDTVHLMGFKKNPYKYMKQCDLFVCSSRYEGLSTAVSEAIILGLPVVTTRCSGMTEILGENNEYGLIVENDEASLHEGMLTLLKDKKLLEYYREKSNERKSFFSIEKTVREVEELLEGV
ncbi:glycosyltransferase [Ferdinandcohnia quinoae]|uniref:Glycosyltransferase n=1 Tax=Fredinandcohnia quinoae TaxID=2918902 RepID=A0AAW5E6W9_9BACI|nr:glycosyltransferase [Fredinandcohnia sp. SECRCQ15]MCH1624888.1 glycosyltransferase [Fredinandcohnia sp. SECRCQ15]